MSATSVWFVIALVMLGSEMLLGTIYLLAIFLGAMAAAFCSMYEPELSVQLWTAGIGSVVGAVLAHLFRHHLRKLNLRHHHSADNLDEGQRVEVTEVLGDGTATVSYRGARWTALSSDGSPLEKGIWSVSSINGTRLILERKLF